MSNTEKPVDMICIVCPQGCHLKIDGGLNVTGNTCPRGEAYARTEVTHPTRTVTSTVRLNGGRVSRIPVKTSCPVPKEKIFEVMAVIQSLNATAPVTCGQVLLERVLGTDADIVATRTVVR